MSTKKISKMTSVACECLRKAVREELQKKALLGQDCINGSLGDLSPTEFVECCISSASPTAQFQETNKAVKLNICTTSGPTAGCRSRF